MKSVVSVLVGLIAGWLLTESDDLMPDVFTNWVGQAVAGSGAISAALDILPVSSETAHSIHVCVIVVSILIVPVLGISVVSAGVYWWSRKARLIIYSSLVVPLFMTATAIYYKYQLAEYDPRLARSFWSNAGGNVHSYLLSVCLFAIAFMVIKQVMKPASRVQSHNQ